MQVREHEVRVAPHSVRRTVVDEPQAAALQEEGAGGDQDQGAVLDVEGLEGEATDRQRFAPLLPRGSNSRRFAAPLCSSQAFKITKAAAVTLQATMRRVVQQAKFRVALKESQEEKKLENQLVALQKKLAQEEERR